MPKTALNKFYVALGGLVAVFVGAIEDGHVTNKEWGALAIALYTAVGVWFVSNPQVDESGALVGKDGKPVDSGQGNLALFCVVVVAVIVALLIVRAL